MQIGELFKEHHTTISLLGGPLIIWLVWKLPKLHWSLKLILVLSALLFAIGVWGMILNSYLVPALLIWCAMRKGVALRPILWLTLALAVLLLLTAVAFLLYVFYQHPGDIIKNIMNPLIVLYFVPGALLMIFSGIVQEKIDAQAKAKEKADEDRSG